MKIKKENVPYDLWLFFAILFLLVSGSVMVVSAGAFIAEYKFHNKNYFMVHQLTNAGIAFGAFIIAMNLNYQNYRKKILIYGITAVTLLALIYLLVSNHGSTIKGAKRWIFGFQPSELAKLTVVFLFAFLLDKNRRYLTEFKKGFVVHLVILSVFVALIFKQPDFSTSMMIFVSGYGLFFLAGMKFWHIITAIIPLTLIIAVMVMMGSYRMDRINSFLNQEKNSSGSGWQVKQSLIGFGNGGISGVGLGESRQKEFYLPEPHNDFIFSIVGDEMGFAGTISMVIAYMVIMFRGFMIARNAPDFYGFLLASGITISVILYAGFNMGITLGVFPATGLPLPLVSYGGTSLILTLFSLGVLLNISYKTAGKKSLIPSKKKR